MSIVHVIPVDDLKEHTKETTCACEPRVDVVEGGMIVVHMAYDGRHLIEQVEEMLKTKKKDDPFKWMQSWLEAYDRAHSTKLSEEVMQWILQQPMGA